MKILKVLSVIILVFIVTFSINKFMLSIERNKIVGYGEKIEIKGKNINIVEKGLENNQVVIIDPGYGTTAPGLDFKPLMDELSQTYHVIAIEPFGYGDSDTIGSPRTVENITDELHQAFKNWDTRNIFCVRIRFLEFIRYIIWTNTKTRLQDLLEWIHRFRINWSTLAILFFRF